jgi:hypothetical protein
MPNTPHRRKIHFDTLDDAIADATRLAAGPVTTTGNFSFGQILEHLSRAMDTVTGDLKPMPVPLPLRLAARLARPLLIARPFMSGFKLPANAQSLLWPSDQVDVATGLAALQKSVARFRQVEPLQPHPVFGQMNRAQHEQIQCRHSELHLSFVHTANEINRSVRPRAT